MGLTESKVVVTKEQVEAQAAGSVGNGRGHHTPGGEGEQQGGHERIVLSRHANKIQGRPSYLPGGLPLLFAKTGVGESGVPNNQRLQNFIRSPTVEQVLGETAKFVLNGDKAVATKLAGEVIPSLQIIV